MDPILAACAYVFGAACTGGWTVGIQGFGRDYHERLLTSLCILLWPGFWLIAAGMAIANWGER